MSDAGTSFAELNERLLERARSLVPSWLPGGKFQGDEWVVRNPKRDDKKAGSFKVNCVNGLWKDWAGGDGGSDLISLYAWLHGLKQGAAAKELREVLALPAPQDNGTHKARKRAQWQVVLPAPEHPPPPHTHFKFGPPSRTWRYALANGDTACWVYRFDTAEGKEIWPATWCRDETGRYEWRWKHLEAPRPLYRLDELTRRASDPVLVCEGEKAADAGQELLPQWVATTNLAGSDSAHRTDWAPLAGRRVVIWPDADEKSATWATKLTKALRKLGCEVEWIVPPTDAPKAWDAADALAEEWTSEQALALLGDAPVAVRTTRSAKIEPDSMRVAQGQPWREALPLDESSGMPWPLPVGGFRVEAAGVIKPDGGLACPRPIWVHALTETSGGEKGILLRYFDRRWRYQEMAVPVALMHRSGGDLAVLLHGEGGFPMVAGQEKQVSRYLSLQEANCGRVVQATSRLGWFEGDDGLLFLRPGEIVGGDAEHEIAYQSDIPLSYAESLRSSGTVAGWQREVVARVSGNPFLMFAVMAALAGPLLRPCQEGSGGFHFYGVTSRGKTTLSQVATSVWGCGAEPSLDASKSAVRKWDLTATAVESIAELHSHQVLALDDILQTELADIGHVAYKLAGGRGKERSSISGQLRPARTWQTIIISNGEISLARLSETRYQRKLAGGQLLRLLDVPVEDADSGGSIVADAHGQDSKLFVEALKEACGQEYGTAGPAFVRHLMRRAGARGMVGLGGDLRERLRLIEGEITEQLGQTYSNEVLRAMRRFALVALAGLESSEQDGAGLVPWDGEQIMRSVMLVLRAWLSGLGESTNDVERGIAHLRAQLLRSAERFQQLDYKTIPRDRAGWRTDTGEYWLVLPEVFDEFCGIYDARTLLRELSRRGMLWHDAGRLTRKAPASAEAIKEFKGRRPYCYWINSAIVGSDADDDDDDGVPF